VGQILCSRSLLSTCESQQIFGPARSAQKPMIYQTHKYCLFSALLTTDAFVEHVVWALIQYVESLVWPILETAVRSGVPQQVHFPPRM